ncbi:MAG: hypothetical protein QOE61_3763, partial [Micromonosporaceae bacterium]|nr:hypothetical protein [Micromonosporaceae bacterium]
RLLVPESLDANPLPGLDVHGEAEQDWLLRGGSVGMLEVQPIYQDGRVRGLILPPPGSGKGARLPAVPEGPIPEGQFVVAAHSSHGVVMGSLLRPGAAMAEMVPIPPAQMVELVEAAENFAAGTVVVFQVPGLGDRLPTVPAPQHYVQQVADLMGTPAQATGEVDYPGDALSEGRRTFIPLNPQLESSDEAGHLQLISLSPQQRAGVDLANRSRHPWGSMVAEVFLPVLSDGSLGLHFPGEAGQAGRNYPVAVPTLAAALARFLQGRPFIIRPVDGGEAVVGRQTRVHASITHVQALVARLTGGDPFFAYGSADALAITEDEARHLVDQADRAAAADVSPTGPAAEAARRRVLAADLVSRLRQPLADGLDEQAGRRVSAAGEAVAGVYAAILPLLPSDWVADVQAVGGLWVRPVTHVAAQRAAVNSASPSPAEGLIVIGAAGHEVPPQVWQVVRSALESMAPVERGQLRVQAIDTTASAHRLADLGMLVDDEVPPPPYSVPAGTPLRITADSHPEAGTPRARAAATVVPRQSTVERGQPAVGAAQPLVVPPVALGGQRLAAAIVAFRARADVYLRENPLPADVDTSRARFELAAVWLEASDRVANPAGGAPEWNTLVAGGLGLVQPTRSPVGNARSLPGIDDPGRLSVGDEVTVTAAALGYVRPEPVLGGDVLFVVADPEARDIAGLVGDDSGRIMFANGTVLRVTGVSDNGRVVELAHRGRGPLPPVAGSSADRASGPDRGRDEVGKGKGKRRESPVGQEVAGRQEDLEELQGLLDLQRRLEAEIEAGPAPAASPAEESARLDRVKWAQERLPQVQAQIAVLVARLYPADSGAEPAQSQGTAASSAVDDAGSLPTPTATPSTPAASGGVLAGGGPVGLPPLAMEPVVMASAPPSPAVQSSGSSTAVDEIALGATGGSAAAGGSSVAARPAGGLSGGSRVVPPAAGAPLVGQRGGAAAGVAGQRGRAVELPLGAAGRAGDGRRLEELWAGDTAHWLGVLDRLAGDAPPPSLSERPEGFPVDRGEAFSVYARARGEYEAAALAAARETPEHSADPGLSVAAERLRARELAARNGLGVAQRWLAMWGITDAEAAWQAAGAFSTEIAAAKDATKTSGLDAGASGAARSAPSYRDGVSARRRVRFVLPQPGRTQQHPAPAAQPPRRPRWRLDRFAGLTFRATVTPRPDLSALESNPRPAAVPTLRRRRWRISLFDGLTVRALVTPRPGVPTPTTRIGEPPRRPRPITRSNETPALPVPPPLEQTTTTPSVTAPAPRSGQASPVVTGDVGAGSASRPRPSRPIGTEATGRFNAFAAIADLPTRPPGLAALAQSGPRHPLLPGPSTSQSTGRAERAGDPAAERGRGSVSESGERVTLASLFADAPDGTLPAEVLPGDVVRLGPYAITVAGSGISRLRPESSPADAAWRTDQVVWRWDRSAPHAATLVDRRGMTSELGQLDVAVQDGVIASPVFFPAGTRLATALPVLAGRLPTSLEQRRAGLIASLDGMSHLLTRIPVGDAGQEQAGPRALVRELLETMRNEAGVAEDAQLAELQEKVAALSYAFFLWRQVLHDHGQQSSELLALFGRVPLRPDWYAELTARLRQLTEKLTHLPTDPRDARTQSDSPLGRVWTRDEARRQLIHATGRLEAALLAGDGPSPMPWSGADPASHDELSEARQALEALLTEIGRVVQARAMPVTETPDQPEDWAPRERFSPPLWLVPPDDDVRPSLGSADHVRDFSDALINKIKTEIRTALPNDLVPTAAELDQILDAAVTRQALLDASPDLINDEWTFDIRGHLVAVWVGLGREAGAWQQTSDALEIRLKQTTSRQGRHGRSRGHMQFLDTNANLTWILNHEPALAHEGFATNEAYAGVATVVWNEHEETRVLTAATKSERTIKSSSYVAYEFAFAAKVNVRVTSPKAIVTANTDRLTGLPGAMKILVSRETARPIDEAAREFSEATHPAYDNPVFAASKVEPDTRVKLPRNSAAETFNQTAALRRAVESYVSDLAKPGSPEHARLLAGLKVRPITAGSYTAAAKGYEIVFGHIQGQAPASVTIHFAPVNPKVVIEKDDATWMDLDDQTMLAYNNEQVAADAFDIPPGLLLQAFGFHLPIGELEPYLMAWPTLDAIKIRSGPSLDISDLSGVRYTGEPTAVAGLDVWYWLVRSDRP